MDECPICLDDLDESSPALGCGHRCHAHCLGQLAHALGSTPTRRGTKLSCPTCRRESRVAICAPHTAEFSVGDAVLGLWGHRWFPGVVDAVIDGGRAYEIAYDDGDHAEVTANHCRRRHDPGAPAPDDEDEAGEDDEEQGDASESDGEETVVYVEWEAPRYHGIQWDSGQHKWMARYKNPKTGERVIVGYYSDDIEAARAHDAAVRTAGLGASGSYRFNHRAREKSGKNPYIGVVWDRDSEKYKAEYEDVNGDSQHIGDFDDAVKAAEAYNATIRREGLSSTRELNPLYDGVPIPREEARRSGAARCCRDRKGIKLNRELNGVLIPLPPEEPNFDGSEVVPPTRSPSLVPRASSQYVGVSWNAEPPRWTARFTIFTSMEYHPGKATVVIGYFRTEEEAALAYNAAIHRYGLESTHETNPVVNGAPVPKPRAWISPHQPKGPQIRESLLRRKRAAPGRFKAPERPELLKRHRMRKAEREWRELARAAPAPAKKRRGALDSHNGAGLREAPLHPRRRSVPVRRFSAETPDEARGD